MYPSITPKARHGLRSVLNAFLLPACLMLAAFSPVSPLAAATPPDLTNGGVPDSTNRLNLGPTGMFGWIYWGSDGVRTSASRQILVSKVDEGSPADGIILPGDVILGASGTGADPVAFSDDARISYALAIGDAEANSPAILKLLVWRDGETEIASLELETLGAYSATAPYNCPKSALLLEKSLDYFLNNPRGGVSNAGLLAILASNDPSNPKNAARQDFVRDRVYEKLPSPERINQIMSNVVPPNSAWSLAYDLILIGEYYLQTQDPAVLPGLEALSILAANGTSHLGTVGHRLNTTFSGPLDRSYTRGYGTMNSAGIPLYYGLLLAKKAGINHAVVLEKLDKASKTYAAYAKLGRHPYGEHAPFFTAGHAANGKSGTAAVAFMLDENRAEETKFYGKMSVASINDREFGHTGSYFNELWTPLGAAAVGEEAASAHFKEIRWMLDLSRQWNGDYYWNAARAFSRQAPAAGNYNGVAMLGYALPLRQIYMTGREHDPARFISSQEVTDAIAADRYDATSRTTAELVGDLGFWSPPVRFQAAVELGTRTAEHAALLPQIINMANDPSAGDARLGACLALGRISGNDAAEALVALFEDPDYRVRFFAGHGFFFLKREDAVPFIDAALLAATAIQRPFNPKEEDPMQFGQLGIYFALFNESAVLGKDRINTYQVNRRLLYPAFQAAAEHPMSEIRSDLRFIYPHLTNADFNALAGVIVDAAADYAPANKMSAAGSRIGGIRELLDRGSYREAIPLISRFINDDTSQLNRFTNDLLELAGGSMLVEPDPKLAELLYDISLFHLGVSRQVDAQNILAAIASDLNPIPMPSLKTIHSVTAMPAELSLPARRSTLLANTSEIGDSSPTFTWKKIHGRGEVNFVPNGTTDADRTEVYFDGTPGVYSFEVTMIDKNGLVLLRDEVNVALKDSAGNLPTNNPPVADAQSLSVPRWSPTPITLSGSDPDGLPLVYRVIQQPANGSLSGEAPHLVYTSDSSFTGSDSFTFEVIDSEGATATASISLTVEAVSDYAEVAIYEPFEYLPSELNGQSSTADVGFAGPWETGGSLLVANSSVQYGDFITKGGHLAAEANGPGSRIIDASALADRGLLDDGATLWFSIVAESTVDAGTFTSFHLALANNSFGGTVSFNVRVPDNGDEPGSGFGVLFNQTWPRGAHYTSDSVITGTMDNREKEFQNQSMGAGKKRLIVGRFIWADNPNDLDRIEIFMPGPNLELRSARPQSILEGKVDQSAFDRLNLWVDNHMRVDEIRFASTYRGVIVGTQAEVADTAAPGDGIASFQQLPTVINATSIAMSAKPEYDQSGVEYYFTSTSGGGNDSGWQSSPSYTDTGLTPGVTYTYTVTLRDLSPAQNTSAPSAPASATIGADTVVPDVSGLQRNLAEQALALDGLGLGSITSEYSQIIPLDEVLGQTPNPGVTVARGSSVDLLVSAGPDPALPFLSPADITSNLTSSSTFQFSPVTYTLTFNMAMDASTVDASDLVNLGTSAMEINSITQSAPEVFTVVITPTQSGTLRLGILAGASIASASGDWLDTTLPINHDELYEVIWVNSPPVWLSDPVVAPSAVEGFPYLSGLVDDVNDVDGDVLTFTKVSGPAWLSIAPDGEMTGLPAVSDIGLNSFQVSVTDGTAPAVQATVEITVEEAPRTVIFADDFEVASGSPDVDAAGSEGATSGQTNTDKWDRGSTGFGGVNHGIVDESSGYFTDPDGEQGYALRYSTAGITSVEGAIGNLTAGTIYTVSFDVVLDEVDETLRDSYNVALVTFAPEANRIDTRGFNNGTAQILATLSGTGATNTYQRKTFTYVASGNESSLGMDVALRFRGSSTSAIIDNVEVAVSVPGLGLAAIDTDISGQTTRATVPVVYTFSFNKEVDATTLDATDFANFGTSNVTLGPISQVSPGVVTVEVTPTDVGSLRMGITAGASILGAGGEVLDTTSAILDYSIYEVTPENTPPFWLSDPVVKMDAFYSLPYADSLVDNADDAEDPVLTFAKVSGPAWLSVATDGSLAGTPAKSNVGLNRFVVSVTDGKTPPIEGRLEIQVINVNDAPVWTSAPVVADSAPIRTLYAYNLSEDTFDADGDSLTFAMVAGPSWAVVSEEGWLIGQPQNTDLGLNSFVVSVSDGIADPVSVTVEVQVITTDTNEPSVFITDPISARDASVDTLYFGSIAGSATDPDGDIPIYAKVSGPEWLIVAEDGTLAGTPASSDLGSNSFIVSAGDGIAAPVTATLNIEVREPNDAPVFIADPIAGNNAMENNGHSGTLAGTATDAEGDPLVYAKISGPEWLNVAEDGTLSGMPLMTGDAGPNSFIVSVSDGINPPVEATLNIEVLVQPAEYIWTGAAGPGSEWYDAANWQDGNVPNTSDSKSATNTTYSVNTPGKVVIFDAATAVGGYLPTATLTNGNDWFGNYPDWNLSPATIVRSGTINFGNPGSDWRMVADAEIDLEVGDGNMAAPAVVNMGWKAINRIQKFGNNGVVIQVNRDGFVNQLRGLAYFINNSSSSDPPVRIILNGGKWHVNGIVENLAVGENTALRTISFDAPGAEFTAQFGGDFPDLAAVTAEIGTSFVDTTGQGIEATDNGDGTFTVVSLSVFNAFEQWAGPGISPSDDSNADGIPNGLAWVLGATDPYSNASELKPSSDASSDADYYIFTYRRADEAHFDDKTTIDVIYGDDLINWNTAIHDGSTVIITETDDYYGPGIDRVEVKLNWDLVTDNRIFSRLRVEIQP
ncbi:MAG: DUF6288 domain-containing protein [Opitutales bacterium]